ISLARTPTTWTGLGLLSDLHFRSLRWLAAFSASMAEMFNGSKYPKSIPVSRKYSRLINSCFAPEFGTWPCVDRRFLVQGVRSWSDDNILGVDWVLGSNSPSLGL
ncbi:24468_t:CDS:2, partial [Dentiscutata erythropus]